MEQKELNEKVKEINEKFKERNRLIRLSEEELRDEVMKL